MQAYRDRLMSQGYNVQYIEYQKDVTTSFLFNHLRKHKIDVIYHAEITDHELKKRFQQRWPGLFGQPEAIFKW